MFVVEARVIAQLMDQPPFHKYFTTLSSGLTRCDIEKVQIRHKGTKVCNLLEESVVPYDRLQPISIKLMVLYQSRFRTLAFIMNFK